ncbi:hypothetical protein Ddc_08687 [Ditylenchus destructor]|nr:hypothetical protein Ddc_08687 [Ditylenchus destructor]
MLSRRRPKVWELFECDLLKMLLKIHFLWMKERDLRDPRPNQFVSQYLQQLNEDNQDKSQPSTSAVKLHAFNANVKTLLMPSKSKPFNENFLKKMLSLPYKTPKKYQSANNTDEYLIKRPETLIIGTLPTAITQNSLLQSLYNQWIGYLAYNNFKDIQSVYRLSKFSMLTFLHSEAFARLLCGGENKFSDLGLCTPAQKHFSFMFNKVFNVEILKENDDLKGYSFDHFEPLLEDKEKAAKKKLEEAGIHNDRLYPVLFGPRDESEIYTSLGIKSHDIVELHYWMEFTSSLRKSKKCDDELKERLGNIDGPIFENDRKVADIPPIDFLKAFPKVHGIMHRNQAINEKCQSFNNKIMGREYQNIVD